MKFTVTDWNIYKRRMEIANSRKWHRIIYTPKKTAILYEGQTLEVCNSRGIARRKRRLMQKDYKKILTLKTLTN